MKITLGTFLENWGLKLLALILAIVVYYAVKDSLRYPGQSNNKSKSSFINGAAPDARTK